MGRSEPYRLKIYLLELGRVLTGYLLITLQKKGAEGKRKARPNDQAVSSSILARYYRHLTKTDPGNTSLYLYLLQYLQCLPRQQ